MRKYNVGDRVRLTESGKAHVRAEVVDAEGVIAAVEPEDYDGLLVYKLEFPGGQTDWVEEGEVEALENFKIGDRVYVNGAPKGWHFLALPEEIDMPRVFREAYEAGLEAFSVNPPSFRPIAYVCVDSPLVSHLKYNATSRPDWDTEQRYVCAGLAAHGYVQQAREALAAQQAREAKAARKRVLRERGVRIEVKPL